MIRVSEQHTPATQHLGWDGIVVDIEKRFEHTNVVQKYCIDAVSAYLLDQHERAQHDMLALGETLSGALVEICKRHGVDLTDLAVKHIRS